MLEESKGPKRRMLEDLIKIFGSKEKIQKSFDECPFKLTDFFDGILSGQIKNPLGHQYGTYALNKKTNLTLLFGQKTNQYLVIVNFGMNGEG